MGAPEADPAPGKLKKQLGLWHVYAISTGAMFSSGFFLLPGIASDLAGPATVLAYFLAGLLIIPSMLAMAELSTALPRAGGTYYFLDRSLGPAVGTVGGIGTWLSLVLKSGFALVGMGAYLAIAPGIEGFFVPEAASTPWLIKGLAVALAVLFGAINIFGAKESSALQGWLVSILLAVLAFFLVQGAWYVFFRLPEGHLAQQYTPFLHEEKGLGGLVATVGLVFVSYAGLTKVASVSEEVVKPERNLPLGMFLSLATATFVYVGGVFIMVAVLDPETLRRDYTPVATAAESFFDWLPASTGLILVVIAALAAFASTGNAGIFAASRYPMAMARDKLLPASLEKLGHFDTPTRSIVLTTAMMIFFILAFTAEGVAKLASAFNLLVFGMVNLAVIVMRESRIESYDPGYRVPLYPWTPVLGILVSAWLIAEMGWLAILFSAGVVVLGAIWYAWYARPRTERYGAVHHVFERLGRFRHDALHTEFRQIIKEKGLRDNDPFDQIVAHADVIEAGDDDHDFHRIVRLASAAFAKRLSMEADAIEARFAESGRYGGAPISHQVILPHFRSHLVEDSQMVMVRAKRGVCVTLEPDHDGETGEPAAGCEVRAFFFLISPEDQPGQHLRILAQIASRIEAPSFMQDWLAVNDPHKLKEVLLRDERFIVLHVRGSSATRIMEGRRLREIDLPHGTLIASIHRLGSLLVPEGNTRLEEGDRLTIIGEPAAIRSLYQRYAEGEPDQPEARAEDVEA